MDVTRNLVRIQTLLRDLQFEVAAMDNATLRTAKAEEFTSRTLDLVNTPAPSQPTKILGPNDLASTTTRFGTLYVDPPWRYGNTVCRGAAEHHYATMDLDAMRSLPVGELAAEKSHLHVWSTTAFLADALDLIAHWGFEFKSILVWVKPSLGTGNYWRSSTEFLLLGVRGGLKFSTHRFPNWILAQRTKHSEKPTVFRRLIESVSPAPRLELFARVQHEGWTAWGNQIEPTLFD